MDRKVAAWMSLASVVLGAGVAGATPPEIGPIEFFEGDDAIVHAIEDQQWHAIARGGSGYLVVWGEERTVLSGFTQTPYNAQMGNQLDVYGMRLDLEGRPLDPKPIVIANMGRNQINPHVAWNGSNWLVVFESEQPDWYFNDNVYGVRVSPSGEVLDAEPFVIFQQTSNWGGHQPSASSDGTNWLVMWEGVVSDQVPTSAVVGVRVGPDGSILDAEPVVFQTSSSFGIRHPVAAFDGSKYMIAWRRGLGNVEFRRFEPDLTPIDANAVPVTSAEQGPEIATNGDQFMIAADDAFRIANDGTVLDPGGINVFGGGRYRETMAHVAWTGLHWAFTYGNLDSFAYDAHMVRITTGGDVLDPTPIEVASEPGAHEWWVTVAGDGQGAAQVVYVSRGDFVSRAADIYTSKVTAQGSVGPRSDVSLGLTRQSGVDIADGAPDQMLAVFESAASGRRRVLAQRLHADGQAIDIEPIVIAEGNETFGVRPKAAFNGDVYFITWQASGGSLVVGKRLSMQGEVLDATPITIATDRLHGAVAAAGDIFVVGVFEHIRFHEPVQYAEFVRVRGSDGAVLDSESVLMAGGFGRSMVADSVGDDRAFLVWAQFNTHDSNTSYAQGAMIGANGPLTGAFRISGGLGDVPAVGGGADRALVVYSDDTDYLQDDLKARIVMADGSLPFGEVFLSTASNIQRYAGAAWDGTNFLAAWTDYRTNQGIDQLRGDIWAARVSPESMVIDPGGFQLTSGPLPEDLPAVGSTRNGQSIVSFSMLHGMAYPEVQRLAYRTIGTAAASPVLSIRGDCPGLMEVELTGATPGRVVGFIAATGPGTVRIPNGNPCAGTMLDLNASARLVRNDRADENGEVLFNASVGAGACGRLVQAMDVASCRVSNVSGL